MGGILLRIKAWWDAADRSQKVISIGGAAFLVVLFAGTFMFASRPKMVMLYGGLSDADKSAIVTELQGRGIQIGYTTPGVVEVAEAQEAEARMALAASGRAPKSAHMGFEGLDKLGLMTTPAQERERIKVMLEGELARSIETYENIQSARVHITLGDDSPFADQRQAATASVNVTESGAGGLNTEQGRAIATLVAGAVPGMDVKNVSVVNQRMEFVFNGQEMASSGNSAQTKIEMEDAVAKRRQKELQQVLDSVFGAGSTVVSVRCELDLDRKDEEAITRDRAGPGEKQSIREEMPVNAAGTAGGAPGAATATPPGEKYTNTSKSETSIYNETRTTVQKATGTLKSMVINVLANSERFADAEGKSGLESFLTQELANKSQDAANFPAPTVQFVKFDTKAADAAAKAGVEAAGQARMQQIFSLLPILALVVVAVMVIKSLGKMSKNVPVIGYGGGSSPSILQGPVLQQANTLLAAIEGAQEGVAQGYAHIPRNQEEEEILVNSIKGRVHVPLEQIKKTASERPHVVAMLIKSMLLEDRR